MAFSLPPGRLPDNNNQSEVRVDPVQCVCKGKFWFWQIPVTRYRFPAFIVPQIMWRGIHWNDISPHVYIEQIKQFSHGVNGIW